MRLIANHTVPRHPGACLENEVLNPAFDTIRIRDELINQTKAGHFLSLKSLSALIVSTTRRHGINALLQENEISKIRSLF